MKEICETVDIPRCNSYIFSSGNATGALECGEGCFSGSHGGALPRTKVERDVAMSNELLDTLENKVFSAVDTIENLRAENNQLREDRRILEEKLQELIRKMSDLDNGSGASNATEPASSIQAVSEPTGEESSSSGPVSNFHNPYSEY